MSIIRTGTTSRGIYWPKLPLMTRKTDLYRQVCVMSTDWSGRLRRGSRPVDADGDTSHLVIGATGNIGPHLIQRLADMRSRHHRCVSRNPDSQLQELTQRLSTQGTT